MTLPILGPSRAYLRSKRMEGGDYAALERDYHDDPVGLARKIGIVPWSRQREILEAAAVENARVAVRSGHKVGKSLIAVLLALWFIATRGPGARVVFTAPSGHQVKNILWKEFRARYPQIRHLLGGPKSPPLDPGTGLYLPGDRQIVGISTKDTEKLAGLSAPELLFIIDEGSGFPDELFNAIMGNSAGGVSIVALSNPTRPVGWFAEAFDLDDWTGLQISSEESPNVAAGKKLVRGLATLHFIEEMQRRCGKNYMTHPEYMIRVRGEFPDRGEFQVISTADVVAAQKRWLECAGDTVSIYGQLRIGVDPSGSGGDDAVIIAVRGAYAYPPVSLVGEVDGSMIAGEVVRMVRKLRRPTDRAVPVNIDAVSLGAGTYEALRAHAATAAGDLTPIPLKGHDKPLRNPRELQHDRNLRTELWFEAAEWMRTGMIPRETKLKQELITVEYGFDAEALRLVEAKPKIRKKLKRSPNYADALVLAIHASAAPKVGLKTSAGYDDDDYDALGY